MIGQCEVCCGGIATGDYARTPDGDLWNVHSGECADRAGIVEATS